MGFDVKLLGDLEFTVDGVPIAPTAAKPRQLLAMLALNAGHTVSVSALRAEVWNEVPPRSATATLHTYVGALRKLLRAALRRSRVDAEQVLVTEPAGYRLVLPPGSLDTEEYDRHAVIGRRAADAGDYLTATESLGAALALWRGRALADTAPGPNMMADIVMLEETRLADLDLRIGADLQLGRHSRLLGELAGLCARYPTSENFSVKYMLALYRSGQQGRALEVFHLLRSTMIDQLGVDPPACVQRLHTAVLRGDPVVADPYFHTENRLAVGAVG
jgi:DNA-binding SARP family transcriptional activator